MASQYGDHLVIAISSRALFDLEDSHRIFTDEGVEAYQQYQIGKENRVLKPGVAFPLVQKLLALNTDQPQNPKVEVILLSRNSADTGLRVFNSIQHYKLGITRAAFTGGQSPYPYISPFGAHLFLSAESDDVAFALEVGCAAATIVPDCPADVQGGQLKIAFDGDAVLFSDVAERVFKEQGLEAFENTEKAAANDPLPGGPFKEFLAVLHRIQSAYPQAESPIRTALVTARSAPAHERVIRTLRAWDIRIDEAYFLGGLPKGRFLKEFGADIFFDDQTGNVDSATAERVAAGHVKYGVANIKK